MRSLLLSIGGVLVVCCLVLYFGCSETIIGIAEKNKPPEIWLSSGPVEGDTTGYQVHFYWSGWDPDGEIEFYEFVIAEGNPTGFNPEDTTGLDKWTHTTVHDSVFRVAADERPRPYDENSDYTRYDKTHTFFIRAVDMQGKRSEPAHRSFTAWTLAPTIYIDEPVLQSGGKGTQSYSTVITFGWVGRDPIDDPANTQEPAEIRHMWCLNRDTAGVYSDSFNTVNELNKNPWRYEDLWSNWIPYRAEGDSGRTTVIGDDEILSVGKIHYFAVQARDEAGAISSVFTLNENIRRFVVSVTKGPLLTVTENYLGSYMFLGDKMNAVKKDLPPGVPLNFRWVADASEYGGRIVCYRYGWDVKDLSNPDHWDSECRSDIREAPERRLYSGTHTFYVEVYDDGNRRTLAQILIEVIPFSMERNLLWVDDFYAEDPQPDKYQHPGETNHDTFWVDICRRAADFKSDRDVFDCYYTNNTNPPGIKIVGKYKNIIWTYSSNQDAWRKVVQFTPETEVGLGGDIPVNYLALFLEKGGHLWSLGRSESGGGLAAIWRPSSLPLWPATFKFDMAANPNDTSSVNCMGHRDYCVTMLDKIWGSFRTEADEIPENYNRSFDRDAMRYAYRDDNDPITQKYPGLPVQLDLWEEVTLPGRFFDPVFRGFIYCEIYDPEYYMKFKIVESQPCFHPMYRMRARSSISFIDRCVIAIWVDKYSHVLPEVRDGVSVAARSFHFGFPLWFFKRDQVYDIVTVVFSEWQILENP